MPVPIAAIAGLFGGGSGIPGFANDSSAAQSTPFYNSAGIYFDSPNSGNIEAGDSSASAQTTPRALSGGNQAYPDSSIGYGFQEPQGNNTLLYAIIGGAVALLAGAYFLLRK